MDINVIFPCISYILRVATFEDNFPPPFISPNLCYMSGPLLDKFLKSGKFFFSSLVECIG